MAVASRINEGPLMMEMLLQCCRRGTPMSKPRSRRLRGPPYQAMLSCSLAQSDAMTRRQAYLPSGRGVLPRNQKTHPTPHS